MEAGWYNFIQGEEANESQSLVINTKNQIIINKTQALQSFARLMIVLFLIEELVRNSEQCWSKFMKGYENWMGNILLGGDFNMRVRSYLELPPLGLRIFK